MIVAKRQLRSLLYAGLLLLICAGVLSAQTEISGSLEGVLEEDTYLATGDIEVTTFNDLEIEPGTIIYFNQDIEFTIRGTLIAEGAVNDSILFLNTEDSTWSGITFNGAFSDNSSMRYCRVSGSDHRGIHIVNSDLSFDHCVISGNSTIGFADLINHRGAGFYIYSGSPDITNCLVADNESVRGAGVYIWRDGNPSMTNTVIRDNNAIFNNQNEGGHGGGIYFYNCNPSVSDLTVSGNYAQDNGGGMYFYNAHPVVQDCDISDNEADGGGGGIAMIQSEAQVLNCEIYNNTTDLYGGGIHAFNACEPTIDKCLFRNNTANLRGGAIHAYSDGNPTITRNTIVFNTSPTGAGIYIGYNSDGTVNSNIIAFNIEGEGVNASNDSPLSEIAYNNVHSNDAGGMWGNLPDGTGVISTVNENGDPSDVYFNIDEDPQFTDTFLNDYTLESTSPSINAGDPDLPADPDLSIADQGAFPYYQHTPIAFSLLSPLDGTIVYVGGDTTLTWEASADPDGQAVHYDVWMSNSPDLSDAVQIAEGLLATSFAVNDLEDDQDWYWTVHATDTNTDGQWARDTLHFHTHTVEAPGAFALASPADESIQPSTGVMLRWTRSIDADPGDEITYTVQWSDHSNFSPVYQGTTQDTMLFINTLQDIVAEFPDNSTIYWRVRARDSFNQYTWATPQSGWSFDVVDPDPPAAFDLVGPGDLDTCWTGDTTFVWEATTDPDMGDEVTGYMLWVATNPSFTANLDSFFTTGTSYTVNNLQDDVEYWWMVRALDNNTNGRWSSDAWRLRIYIPEAPMAFNLSSPPNNGEVDNDTVNVVWHAPVDPDPNDQMTYTIEWTEDASWSDYYSDTTEELTYEISDLSQPLLTARRELAERYLSGELDLDNIGGLDELDELPDETWVYWRVRAMDSFGNSVQCTPAAGWRFYVNVTDPIEPFSLFSPGDGDTCWTGDTTFAWNHTEDPDGILLYYRFQWAEDEDFTINVDSTAATFDSFMTMNGFEDDQTYWWRVRAGNLSGSSRMSSETWALNIFIPEPPSAFDLLSPPDEDTLFNATPTVSWQASVDPDPGETVRYRVIWATDAAFTQNVDSSAATTSTSATLPALNDDTTYWWRVRALDPRAGDVWSTSTRRFHIYIPEPPADFSYLAPASGSVVEEDTVTVSWHAAVDPDPNDVITYTVYWSTAATFNPLYTATTTETSYRISDLASVLGHGVDELDQLPDNQRIFWKVTAEDSYGFTSDGLPTTGWSFWTNYIDEPPDPFSLLSPSNDDTVWAGDTTLTWQATTEPDPGDDVTGYMVWWATNSGFSDNLDSAAVGAGVTSYHLEDLIDDHAYWWKVRALDNNTNGRWSTDTRRFHAFVPDPPSAFALAAPDSGDLIAEDTVVVYWRQSTDPDLNDEITYTVMWSTDPGFGTVYSGTTQDTSYTITDLANLGPQDEIIGSDELDELPDATTIYWRVRAEDRYNLSTIGTPSHGWSFTTNLPTPPQPFSLLSPSNGDTCWGGDTTLTWQTAIDPDPDDAVLRYVVWIASNSAFTQNLDSISVNAPATTLDLEDLDDDRAYYWKVRAQDGNTTGRWSSTTRYFRTYIPEAPGAFALQSPANGADVDNDTVTVSWTAAVDPDPNDVLTYTVEWSTQSNFATSYTGSTTNTSFQITDLQDYVGNGDELDELPDDTTIYWRVSVRDRFGNIRQATPPEGWSFHIDIPQPPLPFSLVSPADNVTCRTGDTTLVWRSTTDPDPGQTVLYTVWWANNSSFTSNLDSATTADTTCDLNNLADESHYYWKVKAVDDDGNATWSTQTRRFLVYIPEAPSAFNLLSPADGDTSWTGNANLSWQAATDPDHGDVLHYEVWWATNAAFTAGVDSQAVTGTSYTLANLTDDTQYWWKVKVVDNYSLSAWSTSTRSFHVYISEAPGAFTLVSPDSGDVIAEDTVTVTWTASVDPDPGDDVSYRVEWATNPSFTGYYSGTTEETTFDITDLADIVQDLDELEDDITVYWRVRAIDNHSMETLATPNHGWSFSIYIPEAPSAFGLLSPASGDTCWTGDTTLTWQASIDPDPDNVIAYKVWWATNAAFTQGLDSASTNATSYALNNLPDDTRFYWKVRAQDQNSTGTWSTDTRYFDVFIPDAPTAFNLLTPPDESILAMDTVTVTWEASTDADPGDEITYRVEWATNPAFTGYYSGTTLGTTLDITDLADMVQDLDELPDDITVYWRVRAMDKYDQETLATPNEGWSFSVYIPEPPSAFSLLSPDDGDTCWTGDTTLTWQDSTDPDPDDVITYKVWWATNAAFTQGLDSASTNATSYAMNNLPDDTRFYWKARAQDQNSTGTWSTETWHFDVFIPDAPTAFNLLTPPDESVLAIDTVTVTWEASSDPDPGDEITYRVEWATNPAFTGYYSGTTLGTTFDITDLADMVQDLDELPDDITVYWRVRAMDKYDLETLATPNEGWSFSVYIPEPPTAFSLLHPSDGDTCWTGDTTLTWQASSDPDPGDAITYKVWWATNAAFTQGLDSASTAETSYELNNLPDDTRFYWKVRAQDTNTTGTWSTQSWHFDVFIPDAPTAFNLLTPPDGSVLAMDTVTVTWEASTDADPGDEITYRVEWATNPAFTGYYSGTTLGTTFDITDLADVAPELDELPDDITVYWRVRAMDKYDQETLATPNEGWSFSIFIPEQPAAFSLLSPDNGDTCWTGDETLNWQASSDPDPGDAITYKVWWATNAAFTQGLDSASTAETSYELNNLPDDTRFWWKVRAQDTNTTGTWSTETWQFDVFIPETPIAFNLTGPVTGDTCWTGDTTLVWQASSDNDPGDVITYKVWWATNAAFTEGLDSASTSETTYTLNGLDDDTRYWWKVRAQDRYTNGTWSNQVYDFDVFIIEAPGAFSLVAPTDGAAVNDDTVTVSWTQSIDPDANDIVTYRVEWSTSNTFAPLYDDETTETSYNITGLVDMLQDLDELPDDMTVYWRVRAIDRYGFSTTATPSDGWSFTVRIPEEPSAFSLIGPVNGDTCWTGDTTLTWQASVDPDPGDVITYKVWWATNAAFTEGLDSASTAATSYTLHNLADDTRFWWKVRAQDTNTSGVWSTETESFDVFIPEAPGAFALLTPANGALMPNDTVTVSWAASIDPDPGDVVTYRVEWSTSNTFVPLYDDETTETSYMITDLQDVLQDLDEIPDNTTVYWRIRVTDNRGMVNWGTPNAGRSFTIRISDAPYPFSLLDPLDGDTCWTGDTTLTWQVATDPDPGDQIAYKVWWATNAAFTEGLDSVSVTEASYALNNLADDTDYWWKVRAQDGNSSGTWSTETRRLHVYIPEAPSTFSLIEPEHGDTVWTSAVELSWQVANDNDPNDTVEYWVFWANDPGFTTGLDSAVVNQASYTLTGLMDDHTYFWKVRAQDNYTGGTWSTQTRMFRVYMIGFPDAFSLIGPLNGDTCWTGDTTLVWHETTDPDPDDDITYVIWWANDEAFIEGLDSTTTTDTTLSLEDLSDDTPYWWKVRAQDQNTAGTWSTQTFGFHVYIPESPVTFGLALPENEATVTTDTVTIYWHPATDPDPGDVIHYDIELAMLPDFSHTQEASTSDTSFIITDFIQQMAGELDELEDDQTYYWRVFAEDRFGLNVGCTPITGYAFTVHVPEPPEAFSLISPFDEDTCWTGDTTLVWHSSSDPDPGDVITYHIWIANDEQFTVGLDSMATADTTLELVDLPDDTPFWWKVRAQDMNTEGTWSTETGMFEVFIPEAPAAFSLLSPLNGVTLEMTDVDLEWQESSDNDPDDDLEYVLYWSLSENFVTGVDSITLTETEHTLAGLSDDTQYWWKVRAQDHYTVGTWSTQTWTFSVGVPQSPFPFSLISPVEGDTIWSSEGNFFWHGTSDPDPEEDFTYHFQIATDPLFTLNFEEQVLEMDTGAVATGLMDDTRYWWRVVAIDEQDHATYSNETWYFDVYIPEAPEEFSLLLPENEAIIEDDTVLVYWEPTTDPDPGDWIRYTVQWSMFEQFTEYATATTLDTMLSINGLEDQILAELDELPDDISVYWRVLAIDQYADTTWATPETGYVFHVSYEHSPPLAFDLVEPADGDTVFTGEPIVRWETAVEPDPGDSVASYTIVWAEDAVFTVGVDSTTGLEDTSYVFEGLTDETMYWWKVRAVDTNTNGAWSTSNFSFLVYIPEPPTAFNLLSPEDEALVAEDTVTVTWSSSSDPDAGDTLTYHVVWSIDPEFGIANDSLVTDTTMQIGYVDLPTAQVQRKSTEPAGFGSQSRKSRNTEFGESVGLQKSDRLGELDELDELDELLDGLTIYWKVECSDEYGNTIWAEPETGWSFTVNLPSLPDTFSLHEPLNSDTVWTDSTQLVWFFADEPDPDDEITDYVIWWASDEDFTEDLDSAVVTLFNTHWLYNLTDDTRYWWKVRANDGNSVGRWCNEPFNFLVYIPEPPTAPELISPDNETIATESVVLQWNGSTDPDPNDEIRYVVVWSRSQDFLEIDSTVSTETTATLHGLEDDSDYWWHVRAQDQYTEGTWSDTVFTFSLSIPEPPAAFQLYGPDDEATVSDSSVTLAWQNTSDPDPGDEVEYELAIAWNASFTPAAYFSLEDTTYLLDGIDDLPVLPGMMQVESNQQELGVAKKGQRNSQNTRSNSGPSGFGSVNFTSNGANSLRVTSLDDSIPLPDDATIFWKVTAIDQDNQRTAGTPANGKSFSLYYPDPPEAFSLLEPANGASLPYGNVSLRWEETTDPDPDDELTYVVVWSLDDSFDEDDDSLVVHGTTTTIGGLLGNTTYYWQVRAQDTNTSGTWSDDVFTFSLEEDHPPTAFSLLSPQDEDTIYSRSLTLDWEESEDPDNFGISYVVWLSTDEFFQDHVDSIFTDTTIFTLSNLQDEIDYWWAVRAIDPSGNGTWCDDSYTFHVSIPQAPRAFDIIAPDNNAVVSSPNVEFSWESTTDPDPNDSLVYVLQWSWHPTFSGALNIITEDTSAIVGPDSLPDNTTVYWRVKAVDRFGMYRWGGVLSGYTFRTDFPDVPSVFELSAPSAGSYMNRDSLALSWMESVDPDSYDVPCYDVWIDTNAAMSTAWLVGDSVRMTSFWLMASDVFPGLDHYWTVRATDSNTSGTWASDTLLVHVSSHAGQPPAWSGVPESFGIPATYPNPFNSSMTAIVGLPARSDIYVAVYDVLGRKVAVLASGRYDAGYHKFGLQADRLASGVYFVQARGSGFGTQLKKIVLVR